MKFYTVGYGGRTPDAFLNLLNEKLVKSIVDVRLRPDRSSMGVYVKAKDPEKGIEALLNRGGIKYYSFIELGNIFLDFPDDWREKCEKLLEQSGELLIGRLDNVTEPFCLMCAEKKVKDCHREQISNYMVKKKGWHVEHIE